jgi:hypothetical protein
MVELVHLSPRRGHCLGVHCGLGTGGLVSTNTNKTQFTQRLPLGPKPHMGKERCCLRGLDHLHGPACPCGC